MSKYLLLLFIAAVITGCTKENEEEKQLRNEMDVLKRSLDSISSLNFDSMKQELEKDLRDLENMEKEHDSLKKKIDKLDKELN